MAEQLMLKKTPVHHILECPLCLHQLKLPHTLQQCLHSYCKSCLDKMPQKTQDGRQGWLCHMCENFTKCDQVQHNIFIEELQKLHSEPEDFKQIKCEQCSDDCGPATWKCAECKIGLCESAKITHLRIPMLKDHNVVPLDSDGEKMIDNIVFCKVHTSIPAQQNCLDCDLLICHKCNTSGHKGHKAETVEEALERILPEAESSVRQVDENISIIEAQIEGVKKEIEKTKESYAYCRMQMDDHIEKVISRIRAMKAKMEEDVNEQESIALDTLKGLKQQLEKQLSQASVISNLTAVIATKTKHTSQLQQLQTGLLEKVKFAGEVKNQSLSYYLPNTNFIEGRSFHEEIDKVFGKLCFDINKEMINISGESCTRANQFLCSDFIKLNKTQFKKYKEIVVDARWCKRLSYIDNSIWLPLDSRMKINIYDEDGELTNVFDTGDKRITIVKIAHNGDVICAGDSGLFVTDKKSNKWTMLCPGSFTDVIVDKDQLIALQYDNPSVHTYRSVKSDSNRQESSWNKCHSFILNEDVTINCTSSICILDERYLLIATITNALYKLTRVSGEYIASCKELPFYPLICGTDKNGRVLVVDFITGSMYLFTEFSEKEAQRTTVLSDVEAPETRSVVIDQNNNLWVLAGNNGIYKLIKFASQ